MWYYTIYREAEKYLGGACAMLGEWSDFQVVLICRNDYDSEGSVYNAVSW